MSADLSQFIDIHVHILPGVDDGPKSLTESTDMAKTYASVGVRQLIATPHYIPGTAWAVGRDLIARKLKELEKHFTGEGISLKIFPGMEIAYHNNIMDRLAKGLLQPLANSNTYLLEPSFRDSPDALLSSARQMMDTGCGVILAHPERIPSFQETNKFLTDLIGQGLQIQVNVGSLLGKFGKSSKKLAMFLIDNNCVHFLASDAHSALGRCPLNRSDWQRLTELLGDDLLSRLCVVNPSLLTNRN